MKLNKNSFIVAIIVFFAVVGFWYLSVIFNNEKSEAVSVMEAGYETTENLTEKSQNTEFKVYITGEVEKPGVYSAKSSDRVEDIVKLAGGFTKDADKENVNMAAYVKDTEHIVIGKVNKNIDKSENSIQNKVEDNLIDINTADIEKLKTLSGIGDVIAKEIIDYRTQNGGFKKIEDIKNVSSIGDKRFEKIKNYIKVS